MQRDLELSLLQINPEEIGWQEVGGRERVDLLQKTSW